MQHLCDVYSQRPIDCRLFSFDLLKKNGKFFWIVWNIGCPIIKSYSRKEFEPYLREHELIIIPKFKKYISAYSQFRLEESIKNFGEPMVLRKVLL